MSETNAATIEFKGKTYTLSTITVDMLEDLNSFASNQAWRSVERTRKYCTDEEYQRRYEATTRLVNADAYAWHTAAGQQIHQSSEGKAFELFLRMRAGHPEVTLDLAKRIVEERLIEVLNAMNDTDSLAALKAEAEKKDREGVQNG